MGAAEERARVLEQVRELKASAPPRHGPDHVRLLGMIQLPLKAVTGSFPYKTAVREEALWDAMAAGRFIAPIVVDEHLRVIDGAVRLTAARKHRLKTVPAVVVDATDVQANYLAVVLNKSAQVQRWQWQKLDEWLHTHGATYLWALEPLGIFGEQVIPDSYMANNMLNYRVDLKPGQASYQQEPGMAEWAKVRTAERAAAAGARKERTIFTPFSPRDIRFDAARPLASLKRWTAFKQAGWARKKALKRSIGVTSFVAPLVVHDGVVIDGVMRLEVVRELHEEGWWPSPTVPVIEVSAGWVDAGYLRIVMNRTSEFQRWHHEKVDTFLDTYPTLAPLYEPFGLWSRTVLKQSVWNGTALAFEREAPQRNTIYHPAWSTLQQWQEQQRDRHVFEEGERAASPLKAAGTYRGVFDLTWASTDAQPTHNPDLAMGRFIDSVKAEAPSLAR